jgi:hypothetical protein
MRRSVRFVLSVATAGVLSLGATACGDSDTEASVEENPQLTELTSQAQAEMDTVFEEQLAEYYKAVSIEPAPPSTVIFRYVYKDEVDPGEAKAKLDGEAKTLGKTATDTVIPGMEEAGIEDGAVTYVYENPDGTVLWERTFGEK